MVLYKYFPGLPECLADSNNSHPIEKFRVSLQTCLFHIYFYVTVPEGLATPCRYAVRMLQAVGVLLAVLKVSLSGNTYEENSSRRPKSPGR